MSRPQAATWVDNAELVAAAFVLLADNGLWQPEGRVVDLTMGDGVWARGIPIDAEYEGWSRLAVTSCPPRTPWADAVSSGGAPPLFDFRNANAIESRSARVVLFDPPYSAKGGRETSGVKEMDVAYGNDDSPPTPDLLLGMNIGGLMEACRIATHAVLLKSMDYVTGGELHTNNHALETAAGLVGWSVFDRFVHLPTGGRPQPSHGPKVLITDDAGEPVLDAEGNEQFSRVARRELHLRPRPSYLSILVPYKYRKGTTT